jgi:propionate CoA-transferase
MQTFGTTYNPAMSGELRIPAETMEPLQLDARTVIARRAAFELQADAVVNVGVGLPELVGQVAGDERIQDLVTFTVDTGVIGGIPLAGLDFGGAVNREAVMGHASSFDFIDGGGLDTVFLGVGECDGAGNVNVSRFGNRLTGCGGAINLTQRTHNVVFLTPFTSGGLDATIQNGHLVIRKEGRFGKFVADVGQITFSADVATERGQNITYITERCVFRLGQTGLILTETAPGIDIERDILALLPFEPEVGNPVLMNKVLFLPGKMSLRESLLELNLEDRLSYDSESNTIFMDCSGMHVRTPEDVRRIVQTVDTFLGPLERRVYAVVNYDRFQLDELAVDAFADAVRYIEKTYYLPDGVTRHSTNAFMRLKLGREFARRKIQASIYPSAEEAEQRAENE